MKKFILVAVAFFLLGIVVMIPTCHNEAAQKAVQKIENLAK